ncbi:hypothetical protein niasHT_006659 [Heterodera trifolii]|uniref:Uncharacterized protein n=1 Tax=Heterodera trifolii TaxID=157864 RepID=A0ABD2M9Z2_9BILA
MHYYLLGFHILLFSVICLLYQTHGHENDEAYTGYEGVVEKYMHDIGKDDLSLQLALRKSEQGFQSNDNDDYQSVIEASMRELQSQEEKQFELAQTLSMGQSRNNYDNGVGSDNEDIETQQALFQSLSLQSNQRRNNRVSNPQPSNDREFNAEQYYGEASSSSRNANMIKPKKKNKKSTTTTTTNGKKKRNDEVPSSSSTRRSSQSKPQEAKEEPSTSAGSSSRSKTKKDTNEEKGKNPILKSLSKMLPFKKKH